MHRMIASRIIAAYIALGFTPLPQKCFRFLKSRRASRISL
ncbi:MAG: hypothetical protein AVDCRST_MAG26-3491 [uncultured Chloroflexia bacterium]|uniref:Uncharacterized protein n=1 Tax=uncultured Chloroflexia bacterium TaxID=1672391 RepID=A0A6J4JMM0_9CHLR|nr:MAG: hypothetical protein AVDCRST_MAG26-3491 [uncultured Chloroflexia bacterium]